MTAYYGCKNEVMGQERSVCPAFGAEELVKIPPTFHHDVSLSFKLYRPGSYFGLYRDMWTMDVNGCLVQEDVGELTLILHLFSLHPLTLISKS